MPQKTRNNITAAIESNIFDNNNKEILASMVRSVLEDVRDSYFNLKDDELKNFKYNNTQTLEQYLAAVVGAIPIYGTANGIDVGASLGTFSTTGIISSAKSIAVDGQNYLLEVDFSVSVATRRLIPVLTYTSSDWNSQNDVLCPAIRRISSTRINVAMRELAGATQSINFEIIAL